MEDLIIDEIRTNRIEKNERLFKYLAIAACIVVVLKIVLRPEILVGEGSPIDYVISAFPIFLYFNYRSKTSGHKGQFIRWTKDSVEYRSKALHNTVKIDDIKNIQIHLDSIDMTLKDSSVHSVNITDYTEPEDRRRIKNNFELIASRLEKA